MNEEKEKKALSKRTTISIPGDLHDFMEAHRDDVCYSKIFRRAMEKIVPKINIYKDFVKIPDISVIPVKIDPQSTSYVKSDIDDATHFLVQPNLEDA